LYINCDEKCAQVGFESNETLPTNKKYWSFPTFKPSRPYSGLKKVKLQNFLSNVDE
jgi:hypothetical protein